LLVAIGAVVMMVVVQALQIAQLVKSVLSLALYLDAKL
jgi:hypothetical protein